MGPTLGGAHHHHPIEWFREHKEHISRSIAAAIAHELECQLALFPAKPAHKEPEGRE